MDNFYFLLYAFYNEHVFYYQKKCTEIPLSAKRSKFQQCVGPQGMLFTTSAWLSPRRYLTRVTKARAAAHVRSASEQIQVALRQ